MKTFRIEVNYEEKKVNMIVDDDIIDYVDIDGFTCNEIREVIIDIMNSIRFLNGLDK